MDSSGIGMDGRTGSEDGSTYDDETSRGGKQWHTKGYRIRRAVSA